jgi:hypothetical protein
MIFVFVFVFFFFLLFIIYFILDIVNGTPLQLILETIREPPSSLRDDDDVFVILNLTNFISNIPTFADNGGILIFILFCKRRTRREKLIGRWNERMTTKEIHEGEKNAADTELDSLVLLAEDLKKQKLAFDTSQKKSSIQMRTLSESIRKLSTNLEHHSLFIQQVSFSYLSTLAIPLFALSLMLPYK